MYRHNPKTNLTTVLFSTVSFSSFRNYLLPQSAAFLSRRRNLANEMRDKHMPLSFVLLLRAVLLLLSVLTRPFVCQAFARSSTSTSCHHHHRSAWGVMVEMATATGSTGTSSFASTSGIARPATDDASPTTATTPNWRLVPSHAAATAGDDDYRPYLSDRPVWDPAQYAAALKLYEDLMSCADSYVAPGIRSALNTLDHAYRLYGPESVIVSFNGGKDAVVILHLVRAAHAKYYNGTVSTTASAFNSSTCEIVRPRAVYFNHPGEFPEVTEFLKGSVAAYDLDMVAFEQGVNFAAGLKILVEHNFAGSSGESSVVLPMAFVLGTRGSDPNAFGQDHFSPSSHWMPPFMRVNPILDWNYGHIWHFLRLFRLPYCCLYDQGYTSLGTVKDTLPCPALAVNRGDSTNPLEGGSTTTAPNNLPRFWPAYMLRDWDQERAGRIKKEKDNSNNTKTNKVKVAKSPKRNGENTSASSSLAAQTSNAPSVSGLTTVSNARRLVTNKAAGVSSDSNHDATYGEDQEEDNFTVDQSLGSEISGDDCLTKRVGILVVGDEILKGMTMDTNTNTAAQALRRECIKLARVVVVSDDSDEIAREIRRLRNEVDVVITSGGVGPTHDDVTIKGVAKALGREMVFHEEMGDLLKQKMNTTSSELSPAQLKMATLPSNAKLRYLSEIPDEWPVLQCRNVFVLPGVPEFFSKKIRNVAAYLSSQLERSVAYKIVLSCDEASIVDVLNEAVKNHPGVDFGSYPFVNHDYKTVLTLEGSLVDSPPIDMDASGEFPLTDRKLSRNSVFFDRDALILSKEVRDRNVRLALGELITKLPKDSILRVENEDENPLDN